MLIYVLAALVVLVAGWRAWRRLRFFLHTFQLEGYKPNEYGAWLRARLRPTVVSTSHAVGLAALVLLAVASVAGLWLAWAALLVWLVAFASDRRYRSAREKKGLAWTSRMKRLGTTAIAIATIPAGIGTAALLLHGAAGVLGFLLGWLVTDLGAPLWVRLAALLMAPVEGRVQEGYKRQARAKLDRMKRDDLKVVAITGSYGKTSVKFAVAEVLKQRLNALATPGSFNTPMGLCLVINNRLRPEHRVLVAEMGARYEHDIRELAALVPPDISVVTAVGPAHLETMGPIDRIERVKGDLVAALAPGGTAVLNWDDPRVARMTERAPDGVTFWRCSVDGAADADLLARDIAYGPDGARFTVDEPGTGESAEFEAPLLGNHNVLNLLLAAGVGRAMGLRLRQIAQAVARIEPVEHRLELKKEGGVTVIDDAFNSNPVGARNAAEILGQMRVPEGGRRAVVTPGMIELGERQAAENKAFGGHLAHALHGPDDLALLVGPEQSAPIKAGLLEAGFPEDRIVTVRSLFEARDHLRPLLRDGDVVLYENDLPDQYNE